MSKLVGAALQTVRHPLYDASGAVAVGGTPQLVLARSQARCQLILGNNSIGPLWFEFGSARATATIASGAVTSTTITNAGFGFINPPVIEFLGGGSAGNSSYAGLGQPNGASPSKPAKARCVLTGAAVTSIVIDDPGADYVTAPFMFIYNSDLDPIGCAVPAANIGLLIPSGGQPVILNGTACTTDAISVFGATTGQRFTCRWMD